MTDVGGTGRDKSTFIRSPIGPLLFISSVAKAAMNATIVAFL